MSKDNPLPLSHIPPIPGASAFSFVNDSFQPSGDEESVHLQSPPKGKSMTRKDPVRKKRLTRGGTNTIARPSATTCTATFNQPSESVIVNNEPPIAAVSSEGYKSEHQSMLHLPSTSGSSNVISRNETHGLLDESVVIRAPQEGAQKVEEEGTSTSSFVNEAFEPSGDEEPVHPQAHPQGKSTIKLRKDQVHKKGPKVSRRETFTISRSTASAASSNKSRGSATVDIEPPNAQVSSEVDKKAHHGKEGASACVKEAFDLSGDGESIHLQDQPQNKSGIDPRNDQSHKKSHKVRRFTAYIKTCSSAATSAVSSDKPSGSVTLDIEPPIATVSEEVDKCAGQPHLHLAPPSGSSTVTSPRMIYGSRDIVLHDPEKGEQKNRSRKGDEPSKSEEDRSGPSLLNSLRSATSSVVTYFKSRGPFTSDKSQTSSADSDEEYELQTVPKQVSRVEGEEKRKPNEVDDEETRSSSLPSAASSAATSKVTRRTKRDSSSQELEDETAPDNAQHNVPKPEHKKLKKKKKKKKKKRRKIQKTERWGFVFVCVLLISAGIATWFGIATEKFVRNEKSLSIETYDSDLSNEVLFNQCWPLLDNFDLEGFNKATGQAIDRTKMSRQDLFNTIRNSTSNEKVLEFALIPPNLIVGCGGRHLISANQGYQTPPVDDCSMDRITKYLKQESVCFGYDQLRSYGNLWYTEVGNDSENPGEIRSLTINLKAMKGNVTPFYSQKDEIPYKEWIEATEIDLSQYNLTADGVEVEICYRKVCVETSSTFPFKACDKRRKIDLINGCINERCIDELGKVPPVTFINSATATVHPMLTKEDLKNETTNRVYNEIHDKCNQAYQDVESCRSCHIETTYKVRVLKGQPGIMRYKQVISKDPHVTFIRKPVVTFSEYALEVFTIISVFLGSHLYLIANYFFKWNRYKKDGPFLCCLGESDEVDPETQHKMDTAEHKERIKQLEEKVAALTAYITHLDALNDEEKDSQKQQIAELAEQNMQLQEAILKLTRDLSNVKKAHNSAIPTLSAVCPPQSVTAIIHPPPPLPTPSHSSQGPLETLNPVPSPTSSSAAEYPTPRPDSSSSRTSNLTKIVAQQKREIVELVERNRHLEEAQSKLRQNSEELSSIKQMLSSVTSQSNAIHPPQSGQASLNPAPSSASVPSEIPTASAAAESVSLLRRDLSSLNQSHLILEGYLNTVHGNNEKRWKQQYQETDKLFERNTKLEISQLKLSGELGIIKLMLDTFLPHLMEIQPPQSGPASLHPTPSLPAPAPSPISQGRRWKLKEHATRIKRIIEATSSMRPSAPTSPPASPNPVAPPAPSPANLAAEGGLPIPLPDSSSSHVLDLARAAADILAYNQEIEESLDRILLALQRTTHNVNDPAKVRK